VYVLVERQSHRPRLREEKYKSVQESQDGLCSLLGLSGTRIPRLALLSNSDNLASDWVEKNRIVTLVSEIKHVLNGPDDHIDADSSQVRGGIGPKSARCNERNWHTSDSRCYSEKPHWKPLRLQKQRIISVSKENDERPRY